MANYRGKYKKCRSCDHALEVLMELVRVKDTCPKACKLHCALMSDKHTCEACKFYKEVVTDAKSNTANS